MRSRDYRAVGMKTLAAALGGAGYHNLACAGIRQGWDEKFSKKYFFELFPQLLSVHHKIIQSSHDRETGSKEPSVPTQHGTSISTA
ncbi:hypothetical protein TNIN_307521 [Trichonephila inaurata madagascariensis]|uniref:Uncharacterized protein n=1 Tax=Trichonephila inaurata madagascariensis TaxID=2747483 RepID=A0A8X7C3H9_9ARAC|nr:hypothetical protein TNIN_307521 [Trichonephila inaurata madagascariensis]